MALEPLRSRIGLLRRLLAQDGVLCAAPCGDTPFCAHDLPALGDACPRRAGPSPGGAVCGTCLGEPPSFDATVAAWRYGLPVERLVLALKYGGRLALARAFGAAPAARDADRQVELRVPVPLAPARLRSRGFHQAMEIARTSPSSRTGLRACAIRRPRPTFRTMRAVAGRSLAIVDDVMTTGASLAELAGTLQRAGAARVENRVVARAWRH